MRSTQLQRVLASLFREIGGSKLRRLSRTLVFVATLFAVVGATPAFADSPSRSESEKARKNPKTIVIDGREYGPKEGLKVDSLQFEIEPGSGPVGVVFEDTSNGGGPITPEVAWGASYAISTEWWSQLGYDGKAKAAANIFAGQRIIQVCYWYTRGGQLVSAIYCSNATSNGVAWAPGGEVTSAVWDSLDPFAPQTIFHVDTARINPGVF